MWATISDLLWEGYKLSDIKVSWYKIKYWLLPKILYLKDRVQPQPKPAWSEEDERMFTKIEEAIKSYYAPFSKDAEEMLSWFKPIKDRYSWKPSKEQIIALRWVLNNVPYNKHKEEISGLLDQIKNL